MVEESWLWVSRVEALVAVSVGREKVQQPMGGVNEVRVRVFIVRLKQWPLAVATAWIGAGIFPIQLCYPQGTSHGRTSSWPLTVFRCFVRIAASGTWVDKHLVVLHALATVAVSKLRGRDNPARSGAPVRVVPRDVCIPGCRALLVDSRVR